MQNVIILCYFAVCSGLDSGLYKSLELLRYPQRAKNGRRTYMNIPEHKDTALEGVLEPRAPGL